MSVAYPETTGTPLLEEASAAPSSARAAPSAPPAVDSLARSVKALTDEAEQPTLIFDADRRILYANRAVRWLARCCGFDDAGGRMPETLDAFAPELIPEAAVALVRANEEWSGEVFVPSPRRYGLVLQLQLRLLPGDGGEVRIGAIFRDASEEYARGCELQNRNTELELANSRLKGAQEQLVQTEKLASIGQLAAGVAHEINNPIGYVHSNLATLSSYTGQLLTLIELYEEAIGEPRDPRMPEEIRETRARFDFEFLRTDLPQLLAESREGVERVRKIVQDLRDFSRSEATDAWTLADLHVGLESTLNIVWNDLKYKAHVVKTYGDLPRIECVPSELNQVFLNILVNAGQAIEERGVVTLTTSLEGDEVLVSIGDDGVGIPEDVLPRIFDPFFTTKAVGAGTGLGLAISYGIIKKHGGRIEVTSAPGQGTLFNIYLPVSQRKRGPDEH